MRFSAVFDSSSGDDDDDDDSNGTRLSAVYRGQAGILTSQDLNVEQSVVRPRADVPPSNSLSKRKRMSSSTTPQAQGCRIGQIGTHIASLHPQSRKYSHRSSSPMVVPDSEDASPTPAVVQTPKHTRFPDTTPRSLPKFQADNITPVRSSPAPDSEPERQLDFETPTRAPGSQRHSVHFTPSVAQKADEDEQANRTPYVKRCKRRRLASLGVSTRCVVGGPSSAGVVNKDVGPAEEFQDNPGADDTSGQGGASVVSEPVEKETARPKRREPKIRLYSAGYCMRERDTMMRNFKIGPYRERTEEIEDAATFDE